MSKQNSANMTHMFESHPSLSASLEDFEHNERPAALRYPSYRSGFARSDTSGDSSSDTQWTPAANRMSNAAGSGWYRHEPILEESRDIRSISRSKSQSRETTGVDDEEDLTLPANIPLPKGSCSPERRFSASPSPFVARELSVARSKTPEMDNGNEESPGSPGSNNYIRFSIRADMQHRTEPFESLILWLNSTKDYLMSTRKRLATSVTVLIISLLSLQAITKPTSQAPVPDLIKVAGLTRSLEPLIYFSERGVLHVSELQETGVAVWDLSESVRVTNMSGSETIVQQLDDLSATLKSLGTELTKFFASVDGDIDNILIVMEWAKRELGTLGNNPTSTIGSALGNINSLFVRTGLLTDSKTGEPNRAGLILSSVLAPTQEQQARATLQRTFLTFLSTLEESINDEIKHTNKLFALFEMIEQQFLNLQRTTVRELDSQEREEGEMLSSLWQLIMGKRAWRVKKFQKNKALLQSLRKRTVTNKAQVVEHNQRLLAIGENLNVLRQRLLKPVIQEAQGSSVSVDEQIKGLDGTYQFLRKTREEQKARVFEKLYGRDDVKERLEIGV